MTTDGRPTYDCDNSTQDIPQPSAVASNPSAWEVIVLDGKAAWKNLINGDIVSAVGGSARPAQTQPVQPSQPMPQAPVTDWIPSVPTSPVVNAPAPKPYKPPPAPEMTSGPSFLDYLNAAQGSISQMSIPTAPIARQQRGVSTGVKVAVVVGGVAVAGLLLAGFLKK